MNELRGTGVAMITPFTSNGAIDYDAFPKLIDYYIDSGVDYLVVLGTTAETSTLSKQEQTEVARKVVEINAGRLPLVLGKGGNNTLALVEEIKTTNFEGYSAILSVCPYYNRPNQEGIFQHFKAVAIASPLPVLLYNVPARTGASIANATTIRLAETCKNIIGIKDASADLVAGKQLMEALGDAFLVISGDDSTALDLVLLGGAGVISVIAGGTSTEFVDMIRLGQQNEYNQAKEIQRKINPLVDLIFKEGNPTGLKVLMSKLGYCENSLRLPLIPASDQLTAAIEQKLEEFTIFS